MKKILSVLMALALLTCGLATFAVSSSAEATELLELESEWEYLVYEESTEGLTATAPEGWLDGSDSEAWTESDAPFAGQNGNALAVTIFDYQYFSAYLRTTFTVEDPSAFKALELNVIYDENPTVYLNGEVLWSAEGYQDKDYVTFDVTESLSLLKEGENTICVEFSNVYGGSIFDAYLTAYDTLTVVDDDGYVLFSGATCEGFVSFGGINDPTNVLDGDQSSVCGSAWNADVTQSITANFKGAANVTEIYLQCKNEGTTTHEDGMTRGSYDVYLINGDTETKINEEPVPALTIDDGGYVITLDEATEATAVKVVITEWFGDCWACLADVIVNAEIPAEPEPPVVDPTPSEEPSVEPSVEPSEEPSVEPSVEPSEAPSVEPSGEPSNDNEVTPDASEEDKTSESKPADEDNSSDKGGSDTGLIIGIVIAVVAVAAIVVVIVVVSKKKKA